MKRLFLLSSFFVFCLLCSAQINTHIFGLNIGTDTRSQVWDKAEKNGFQPVTMPGEDGGEDCILIYADKSPLTYAQLGWTYVATKFVDDVLYGVFFISLENTQKDCDDITKAMDLKYQKYFLRTEKDSISGVPVRIYSDHTTTIGLNPDPINGICFDYTNDKLAKKAEDAARNRIREMSKDL